MRPIVHVLSVAVLLACAGDAGHPGPPGPGVPSQAGPQGGGPATGSGPSPAAVENALPGDRGWLVKHPAGNHQLEAYALRQSVAPGEAFDVAAQVQAGASTVSWVLYRLGEYQGAGAREILRGGPVPAGAQPPCPPNLTTGLLACAWTPTFTVTVPPTALTGFYVVKLQSSNGYERYVPMVVREAQRLAPILVLASSATWQAYNAWGGESLYDDLQHVTGRGHAFQVSFDRPYLRDDGAGHLLRYERRLAEFLERLGEDVGYADESDLDRDPQLALSARVVILSGHDEYWTSGMRRTLDAAVAGGTSLLLFGANAGYWQIRYGPATDGRERRVVTGYKEDALRLDPAGPSSPDFTGRFRDAPLSHPENALFGVMFRAWNAFSFPMTVADPSHWTLTGTGLTPEDLVPHLGGYEVDDVFDNGATPGGLEVVAQATALPIYGGVTQGSMAVRSVGDALVFAAGGIGFVQALAGDDHADPRVQRIAANVLARALGQPLPDGSVGPPDAPAVLGPPAQDVSTVAGTALDAASVDGPRAVARLRAPVAVATLAGGALALLDTVDGTVRKVAANGDVSTLALPRLSTPLGLAADVDGTLYVADTGASCIRRIDPAGTASVLAGAAGTPGSDDGPGTSARFQAPAGLAVSAHRLYVADVGAGKIRVVDLLAAKNPVSTLAAPALLYPTGVAVAQDGTVHVVETGLKRIVALDASGGLRTVAGTMDVEGYADGPAATSLLRPQLGIAFLPDGALVFADTGNGRVRLVQGGQVTTLAGSGRRGGRDGRGDQADLWLPTGLAVDATGRILLTDTGASTVRVLTR